MSSGTPSVFVETIDDVVRGPENLNPRVRATQEVCVRIENIQDNFPPGLYSGSAIFNGTLFEVELEKVDENRRFIPLMAVTRYQGGYPDPNGTFAEVVSAFEPKYLCL